ncbi:hypothetical protein NDK25_27875 [Niallia taxi]|nr:hypothetical protein [Niallia taxi]MDE5056014.1 hypothetical protein [Niallia taxi]
MSNVFYQLGDLFEKSIFFKVCINLLLGSGLIFIGYIGGKWIGKLFF